MAAIAASAGAKDVQLPDPDAARIEYDEWLTSEPKPIDADQYELKRALGVAP